MPEFAAAAPRVVLLARAGKAADSLAEALRQAGATLLIAADPADTDEPALRALAPEAVLVALEPSIEPALDRLDGLLSDPDLTVIFDEADLAAHRAGWDAARWVRHLSAKLRRDSNVLPPGGEIEQDDLQPSPGSVPKPAAAYADYDFSALAREAEALAGQVPAAQAVQPTPPPAEVPAPAPIAPPPAEPVAPPLPPIEPVFVPPPAPPVAPPPLPPVEVPAPAPVALPADPIAAPPAAVPPQLPPETPPKVSGFDLSGFDLSGLELADFDTPATPAAPAHEPSAAERQFASLGDFALEPIALEPVAPAAPAADDDVEEAMTLESIDLDAVEPDAPAAPSPSLPAFDASAFEGLDIEEIALEATPEPDAAPSIAPMRFDDDAFFLEELSAKPAAGTDAPTLSVIDALPDTFDTPSDPAPSGFASTDFASFDVAPPVSPPPAARTAGPTDVLSFEELFASSIEAAKQIPEAASRTVDAAPERSEAAPPPVPPTFSFEGLSLATDDAPAAPVEAPRETPRAADLSALEARISGLSLVDMDEQQGGAGGFGAEAAGDGAVVIEAGLGGPDPTRQILAALPAEFPAVVLVRLHLQGGRYDRLVAQMERAAALPVALAEAGAIASPGTIYFLPDGVDVHPGADGLAFIADPAPGAQLFATLAPGRTALVFLSGGDPRLIDAAMAASAAGALLIAQAPEDCYDGEACAELRRRGAVSGLPVDLAARLAARWPSRAQS
jgi:chemotaxis response regulator CheB